MALTGLLPWLLPLWPFQLPLNTPSTSGQLTFDHRHAFVASANLPQSFGSTSTARRPQILFNDVLTPRDTRPDHLNEEYTAAGLTSSRIRTRRQRVQRPRDNAAYQAARKDSIYRQTTTPIDWDDWDVEAPDTNDRPTLVELAKLTGDAYALPGDTSWYDVSGKWNTSFPFGWEEGDDGLRGNIFVSNDNSTVIVSIKGTSLWGQGPTRTRDKLNDNLLFSCCCARVDYTWAWNTVCDCFSGSWSCGQTCLEHAMEDDDLFYGVGVNLYNNVTYVYPDAQIWLVGHSLGGSIASLLGATFGTPTIAFEAPGERLAAKRLHLPMPPSRHSPALAHTLHPITHVYHTADPVPQGTCTGIKSLCAKGGYAMETHCHLGTSIVYDTITKLGWSQSLSRHRIAEVITKVLNEDWEEEKPVPDAKGEVDCMDCFKWDFVRDNEL